MVDPVEHAAGPRPDQRARPVPADAAPGAPPREPQPAAEHADEPAAEPTGERPSALVLESSPGPRPGPQRPPGWYRRILVAAVVAALTVPAANGALWPSPSAAARASVPAPTTRATPSATPGAPVQAGDVPAPSAAAVTDLLARRAAAVAERDRSAWLSTVDPAVPGLEHAQEELFDRLTALRPASWRYQLLDPDADLTATDRASLPAGAVLTHVRLTYRLAPGAPEVTRDQHVTLVRRDRWLVAGTRAGSQQPDPWDLGPVTVARGSRSVVVASAGASVPATRTAAEADAAALRVDGIWGKDWPRTAVVLVPQDVDEMAALLGRSSGSGLDQLAAVTTGESAAGGASSRTTGDRVVLNPAGFGELTATGRSAVLTHEFTHLATRASVRTPPPLWLDEGFADYVAYVDTSLRPRDLAADLLDSPKALAGLRGLPADVDFDPATKRVGTAYAQAWLAMQFVAQQGGTAEVVDFYRVAAGLPPLREWRRATVSRPGLRPTTSVERACVEVLGYVEPSFVRRWIVYVRSVAGSG